MMFSNYLYISFNDLLSILFQTNCEILEMTSTISKACGKIFKIAEPTSPYFYPFLPLSFPNSWI